MEFFYQDHATTLGLYGVYIGVYRGFILRFILGFILGLYGVYIGA